LAPRKGRRRNSCAAHFWNSFGLFESQKLCYALLEKGRNHWRCQKLARRFLADVAALRCCGFAPLAQFGNTLYAWREEIACMWRFTRKQWNHQRIPRQNGSPATPSLRFRNFNNYRFRVNVMCS
jgi:hypothetical protein